MLDLAVVKEAEEIGLTLNLSKSEIITRDRVTLDTLLVSLPGARVVDPAHATFLGSPLGDGESVSRAICEKTEALKRVSEKFVTLSAHDALILLRNFRHPETSVSAANSTLFPVREFGGV